MQLVILGSFRSLCRPLPRARVLLRNTTSLHIVADGVPEPRSEGYTQDSL